MPRVAILSDVHGNLPALEAVLDDLDRQGIDEVLVGGDLVGRGPQGSAIVAAIRERGYPSVRGNHEDYLLAFRHRSVPPEWLDVDIEEWAASRWMAAELSADDAAYIQSFPASLRASVAPGLLLVHGTPRSNNEGLGMWTTDDELTRHLGEVEERVLVCAHTHRPMRRELPQGLVVNVGAVGLPFNRDRRAQYAIFEPRPHGWEVEFRQVPYDLARTLAIYESSGFLAHGGVTAQLLRLELEHASPFLVPFLEWSRARALPATMEHVRQFLTLRAER